MTTPQDIDKAVTEVPADQLTKFRAWFHEFEAARFDRRIERDAKAGRLDKLAERALADFRAGREVDSEPGEFTEFTIRLPRKDQAVTPEVPG